MAEILADYTQFDYKKSFWDGQNREYEDFCDRLALRKLLPAHGQKLLDACGGYGRLVPEYLSKFTQVHLFDYAQNLLDEAKKTYGDKIIAKQGSVYALPYLDSEFDTCVMVRATHHLQDLPAAVEQLSRVLKNHGFLILEVANKRNLLEIFRWLLGRSKMRPFSLEPASRSEKGYYNFHPRYVENALRQKKFKIKKVLSVSILRNNILKKLLGVKILCFLEKYLQPSLAFLKLSPSLYYLAEKTDA